MTTAQTMLNVRAARPLRWTVALLVGAGVQAACATRRPEGQPSVLYSPYPTQREVVWAVAPLRNESGVGLIDELALTDTIVNEAQQVRGLSVLPVNRTLAGMRALNLGAVRSQGEALALCRAIGADAIVVGTVHAWHPYDPPTIGLSLALFGVSVHMDAGAERILDPVALRGAPTDRPLDDPPPAQPLSSLSHVLDAASNDTRDLVRRYAEGRHDPDSALGWRRYTASMALYAKFACHEMTRRLLDLERRRLRDSSARAEASASR
jgi:hypothetical protein